ncbi:hypothetical protein TWF225_011643 [Orbilia oligospora]|uniref:Uncharacterized protein n=1 Tax=Orbilia oligospora TaxID=2813651 RepID=A0A7C8PDE8_ORBOL|nr:hypothetical protein TWF751_007564 [Orbilia oligospora]KAF3192853.1 hypothetical protein TWF225_011643 [Orbilia oligospora]KAF3247229.1 hypothetical protein TWF128_008715 [Orbilia oligospora]KAF3262801.1 hypothetical protein TWF217_004099 [Orbilia oligospora]KAF3284509.1 hypothetical protein TWF132_009792 [Orbilia oligospora]
MAIERDRTQSGGITKKKSTTSRIKVPACMSCHSRKIKCDRTRPCQNCVRYGVDCTSAEDDIAYPSSSIMESSDLQALKDRIAHLETLLTKQATHGSNGASISNTTPALSPDTPVSSSSRSEPATPSTVSSENRDKPCLPKTKPSGGGFGVWEITWQPQHMNYLPSLLKDELPPVKFFPKEDALQYLASFVRATFLRKRYAYLDELMETFNQVYSTQGGIPTVPATALTLGLYLALLSGMYPDSFKAFSAYLLVKPTLRLLWSQLSLETLDTILMEVSFLTTTGRLDEGYLCTGAAARVAQALGLHVSNSAIFQNLDETGLERARMIWWEVYCYDRWYSLATGRPLAIRDKDCNTPWPAFTYKPKSVQPPRWQADLWKAKIRLAEITGKITSKLQKPAQKDLPSFYAATSRNPFRPPPEHIGSKLNEELNNLAKDLPPDLADPVAHAPALYLALKFQSAKMMLFRSFLHHQDATIRLQAQEEVFASALTVTRLCYEGQEALKQLTCGTISMILLTCAVALASYSRAHKGKESARAIEAKEAFDTLKASLRCLDRDDVTGPINSLHMKNSEAMRKLQAFLDPTSVTPKPTSPAGQKSPNMTSSLFPTDTNTSMQMDTTYDNSRYSASTGADASPESLNSMPPPQSTPGSMNSYYLGDTAYKPTTHNLSSCQPSTMGQNMTMDMDYDFYNPENYNPELEFGHLVDPFSEAFFAELMSMSEQNMSPEDWSRLLA